MDKKAKAQTWKVGNRTIGPNSPTFIICEIGCNFENNIDRAHEMIRAAGKAGADAVKFQTFTADRLTTKTAKKFWNIPGCPGNTQYEEFKEIIPLTEAQYRSLQRTAVESGVLFFSTPEDEVSADLLAGLSIPLFKISSMNITHFPLLRHVARKKKPVILSTGASTMSEIKEAVACLQKEGNHQIALLHCITNYPTATGDANLRMMTDIQKHFPNIPVGFSDHTRMDDSLQVLVAAVALGARIIEKHFTFDKSRPGYDHEISADYQDLEQLVKAIRITEKALGSATKQPIASEKAVLPFARRSVVSNHRIPAGAVITADMLSIKRPGTGIAPKDLKKVIGSRARMDIPEDEVLTWSMLRSSKK